MKSRVLVVDDEDTIRGLVAQVLAEDGHEVVEASAGEEALEKFRLEPFPLIVTDIHMGKMTGLDLLKEVKVLDPESVVVIMTSNATLESATSALRAGAYDYLVKPFENIELVSAVVNRAIEKIRLIGDNRALIDHLKRNTDELKRVNARLTLMANRDPLTGLFNPRYFREELERELARCRRHDRVFSLIFLDVDQFKHYNDAHSHLVGDDALTTVAEIIRGRCRESTVAARFGGDEFVLLVPEADTEAAPAFAEALRRSVEQHRFQEEQTQPLGNITISLGVTSYPAHGEDATTLIERADNALYASKHAGRNIVSTWNG